MIDFKPFTRRSALKFGLAGTALALSGQRASAQAVTINFWDMIWGGPEYAVAAQTLVNRYNAENPDVKVLYRSLSWSNWYETFVTAVASGSAPDISTGGGFQAVQLYDMDAVLPVDEVIEQLGKAEFLSGTLDAVNYDGHSVGLPWGIDTRVMFYRKDLLAAAGIAVPTNWEEFRAAAKALTKDGRYGLVSSGDGGGIHMLLTMAINNKGGLFDAARSPSITGERTMEALQFLSDLVADGSVNPASVGYSFDDARGVFFRGEAAFFLESPLTPQLADAGTRSKIGIVPPMTGPHGDKGTLQFVNSIMVYKQTAHPKETLKFLRWWSDNAVALWTEGHSSGLPARTSLLANSHFQGDADIAYALENYVPVAKTLAAQTPGTFPVLNEVDGDGFLRSLIQSIWQGQPVGDNAASAQAYLQDLVAK